MFLTSASKCNIEPNGEIFDVSPENDSASPNVKTPCDARSEAQEVFTQAGGIRFSDAGVNFLICGCQHDTQNIVVQSVSDVTSKF